MTIEEKLKIIEESWYSEYAVEILIQALRKAIEQRDEWIGDTETSYYKDQELLEILE